MGGSDWRKLPWKRIGVGSSPPGVVGVPTELPPKTIVIVSVLFISPRSNHRK